MNILRTEFVATAIDESIIRAIICFFFPFFNVNYRVICR